MSDKLFQHEQWIDDIRAKLYKELQELGEEEYKRRKKIQFQKIVEKYNLKVVPSKANR